MPEPERTEILIEWPEQYGIRKAAIGEGLEQLKEESQRAMDLSMSSIREIERDARPDEVEVVLSKKP